MPHVSLNTTNPGQLWRTSHKHMSLLHFTFRAGSTRVLPCELHCVISYVYIHPFYVGTYPIQGQGGVQSLWVQGKEQGWGSDPIMEHTHKPDTGRTCNPDTGRTCNNDTGRTCNTDTGRTCKPDTGRGRATSTRGGRANPTWGGCAAPRCVR